MIQPPTILSSSPTTHVHSPAMRITMNKARWLRVVAVEALRPARLLRQDIEHRIALNALLAHIHHGVASYFTRRTSIRRMNDWLIQPIGAD